MKNLLEKICTILDAIYQIIAEKLTLNTNVSLEKESTIKDEELLDVLDVCSILRISRTSYYRFVNEGKLIPRKIGNRHCYYMSDLDKMIDESRRRGRI